MQAEQESTGMIRVVMRKLPKAHQLVLETFAKLLSTAKEWRSLDNRRRYVGCFDNVNYLQKSMASFVDVYASQQRNNKSDLTAYDKLKGSARVYLAAVKSRKGWDIVALLGGTTWSAVWTNLLGPSGVILVRSASGLFHVWSCEPGSLYWLVAVVKKEGGKFECG